VECSRRNVPDRGREELAIIAAVSRGHFLDPSHQVSRFAPFHDALIPSIARE
jgi:hypothetical protein